MHNSIIYNPQCDGLRWVENASDGLRVTGAAHEVARDHYRRIDHRGWYCDDYQDTLAVGYVLQLPARRGVPQYVAAIADPYNGDAYRVDFTETHDDAGDAALAADGLAERYAEAEREYQRKSDAEQRIEEIADEIAENRADVLAILRERKAAPIASFPALRDAICSRIGALLNERARLFKEREELRWQVA